MTLPATPALSAEEIALASRPLGDGLRQIDLSRAGRALRRLHPGDRNARLRKLDGVEHARVNLSSKRVSVRWLERARRRR